ncbi:hypothetical protein AtEden1_Chr3g0196161 [Arabidopsis thaliana]
MIILSCLAFYLWWLCLSVFFFWIFGSFTGLNTDQSVLQVQYLISSRPFCGQGT